MATDAELLEQLRGISADELLALRNVHEMAQLAASDALRRFVPVSMRVHFSYERAEFEKYIRGFFCLTLQLGATHHDARAKRIAREGA